MALADRVTERLSTARLTHLTRPEATATATPDTAILALACTDAAAEFALLAGLAYDETQAVHVAMAIQGVELVLSRYAGRIDEAWRLRWDSWTVACRALGATQARARLSPETTSALTPSTEVASGEERTPDFDRAEFSDIVPGSWPGASGEADE
ncbi:MAG: hypothetical protein FD152_678 [Xanthobacteraceae bacterium]|nr:MAG: hypothetical protein FD152_678 [Xanthobacteraceae bacterium]